MNAEKQLEDWLAQLDKITEEAVSRFGTLSTEALYWKPNPAVWSIGENLAHLMVLNPDYAIENLLRLQLAAK